MDFFDKIFKRTPNLPSTFKWYEKCLEQNHNKKALNEIRFVVIDTETTGLNPATDRILSIGAVEVINYNIVIDNSFETVLQQQHNNTSAIHIHEITPSTSALGAEKKQVFHDFLTFIDDSILIGHNIGFDFAILNHAYQRSFGFSLLNKTYDTVNLIKRVDTHFSQPGMFNSAELSLESLCERYAVEINDRHTAMGDAMATALLFTKLLKKLEHRGIKNGKQLLSR